MKTTCRAMVLTGPQQLELQTFALPEIGDDDGLLEVELAGVCGSDPGIFRGNQTFGPRPYPLIPGHEIVGRVTKMGAAARRRHGVQEGDRVVVEYAFGCGQCEACREGSYTACSRHYFYGSMVSCKEPPHLFGCYSEYLYIHPNARVHMVGDDISPELGVLICAVIGNGLRWMRQIGNVSVGDAVAVVGPGQQGLAAVAVAKASGAEPIFVAGLERDRARLEMARRFGADETIVVDRQDPVEVIDRATGGRMANVVMDASGHPAGAKLALALTGRKGTLVLPGIYKQDVTLPLDKAITKEIRMLGVFSQDSKAVRPAIKMARAGTYPFEDLITHRFPLEEAERAVRLVAGEVDGETPLKVVLDPRAGEREGVIS